MKSALLSTLLASLAIITSGCSLMAASGDINDGSVERTAAKDNDERMRRLREGGTLRPGEYEALRERMGDGRSAEVSPKPSVEELEQKVEERRREREAQQ